MIIHDLDLGELEWAILGPEWGDRMGTVTAMSWGPHDDHDGRPLHTFHGEDDGDVIAWLEGPEGAAYAAGWCNRAMYEERLRSVGVDGAYRWQADQDAAVRVPA